MEFDISQNLKELFYRYYRNSSGLVCKNSELARKFKQKCFEMLLARRECDTNNTDLNWGNSYDQCYAHIYTATKLQGKDRQRLNVLIDMLWENDSPALRNALRFLLNLSNLNDKSECEDDLKLTRLWNETEFEDSNSNPRQAINRCEMPRLHVDNPERDCARFSWVSLPQHYDHNVVFNSRDQWSSDQLHIPDLSDDLGDQTYRIPRLSLKIYSVYSDTKSSLSESGTKLEVDEGFEETVTPSSGISFKRNTPVDNLSLIDVASREDFYSIYEKHPRTWETQKCKDPPLERCLLTEAGAEVVNQLMGCYMSDLSLISPDQVDTFRRESVLISEEYAVKCILYVLIGIPSKVFVYDEISHRFAETSIVLSGLSPTAFRNMLKEFALSGTYHRRLEEAVELVNLTERSNLVLKALAEGVRRYLFHVRYLVTAMLDKCHLYAPSKFFQLRHDTMAFRSMTFSIAKLLNIAEDSRELGRLPSGFELLEKIYKAVVDSHFNPIFISFFKWALQPYFIFLQDWAFEGRTCEQFGEFPVKANLELCCDVHDEKWWSEGYTLKVGDDNILGSQLMSRVFVCGKTLLVLRHCCPLHPLFSQTSKRPRFNIGLTESAIEKIESEWKSYFSEIDSRLSKRHQPLVESITLSTESTVSEINEETIISPETETSAVADFSKEPMYEVLPYTCKLPQLSDSVVDVARHAATKTPTTESEPLEFNGWVLPALVERCVMQPLRTQASLANRVVLDYLLNEVQLKKHMEFFANHFFMQDGEFSQSLCDLLFAHLMSIDRPTQLLNRMTLISILDEACAQSIGRKDPCLTEFRAKLSFSVRYVPHKFKKHSVTVLECLRLTKPVEWPMSIVITADAHKHYQFIFNFLLQLRLCLWSLSDIYYLLKSSDPSSVPQKCSAKALQRYRLVQFYRQDMLHFIKSVHEHLNLMAFQKSIRKFREDLGQVKSINDLIQSHNAYLKKVAFRCLLTKVAAPLMSILKDVFSSVLEFRWRLLRNNMELALNERWEDDDGKFEQLTTTHRDFKKHSSLLAKAAVTMAREGYQPHFASFLTRLRDCEDET